MICLGQNDYCTEVLQMISARGTRSIRLGKWFWYFRYGRSVQSVHIRILYAPTVGQGCPPVRMRTNQRNEPNHPPHNLPTQTKAKTKTTKNQEPNQLTSETKTTNKNNIVPKIGITTFLCPNVFLTNYYGGP